MWKDAGRDLCAHMKNRGEGKCKAVVNILSIPSHLRQKESLHVPPLNAVLN